MRGRSGVRTGDAESSQTGIDLELIRKGAKMLRTVDVRPRYPEKFEAVGLVDGKLVEIKNGQARVLRQKSS